MSFTIQLQEHPARPVLAIRLHTPVGDLPEHMGRVFGEIMRYLAELHEQPAGYPFAAYYNQDMANLDVEIGFPVRKAFPDKDYIHSGEIPAGPAAVCLYTGPYTDFDAPYAALAKWMDEHGYRGTGVSYEFYLNDPATTPPQELKTQIEFPLSHSLVPLPM